MPLLIGTTEFSGNFTQELFHSMQSALSQLPEPKIIPYSGTQINADNSVVSLQREILRNQLSTPGNRIRYLGTKGLVTCVEVCLYTDNQVEVIHWDSIHYNGLTADIKSFEGNEVFVSLVGGKSEDDETKKTIKAILTALHAAAQTVDKKIIIKSQLLCERNVFRESDRPEVTFFHLRSKVQDLYEQIYEEALPDNFWVDKSMSSFSNEAKAQNVNIRRLIQYMGITLLNSRQYYTPYERGMFTKAWRILSGFHLTGELPLSEITKILNNPNTSITAFVEKDKFLELMSIMFSKQGYDFLVDQFNKTPKAFSDVRLENFVFDCVTHTFIRIHKRTATPYEELRTIKIFDSTNPNYHVYYDNRRSSQEILPVVSETFRKGLIDCGKFDLKLGAILNQDLMNELGKALKQDANRVHTLLLQKLLTTVRWIKINTEFFRSYSPERVLIARPDNARFFRSIPDSSSSTRLSLSDYYENEELVYETASSRALAELTDCKYILKYRKSESYVLDALLPATEVTKERLESIVKILAQHDIHHSVIDFPDKGKYLCIEAINVTENASKIRDSVKCPKQSMKK